MSCCTLGMRVEPPTSTISSMSSFFRLASSRACGEEILRWSNENS